MTDLILGPDVNADLLPLLDAAAWPLAALRLAGLQLYAQQIQADYEGQYDVGPNFYTRLATSGFFGSSGFGSIHLECAAVKDWSPDGVAAAASIVAVIERVGVAGGSVASVTLDEPLVAARDFGIPFAECVAGTCRVIEAIRHQGGPFQVGIVEAYPFSRPAQIIDFFGAIQQAGSSPSALRLDVDVAGFHDQSMTPAHIAHELQWLETAAKSWLIPFEVIIHGQRGNDPVTYHQLALNWASDLRRYLGHWPDRLIVQSWKHLALPVNTPEFDPLSHAALVNDVWALVHPG